MKVGKIVGRNMKRRYLRLKSATSNSILAHIQYYDDEKQARKKNTPNKVIPMRAIASVHKIETNSPLKSPSIVPFHIKLELIKDRDKLHDIYFELDPKENFDDWVSDLEFLVRLPELKIPISLIPLYDCRSPFDLSLVERDEFEDACPVCIIKRELGESSYFEQPNVILALKKNVIIFLNMQTGSQLLAFDIQFLRRCGNWQQLIFVEAGRKSVTGEGYLWMYVESVTLAKCIYSSLSSIMGSTGNKRMERNLTWKQYCSGMLMKSNNNNNTAKSSHNSLPISLAGLQEPLYLNDDVRRHHSLTDGSQLAGTRLSQEPGGVFFSETACPRDARSSAFTDRTSYASWSSVLTQESNLSVESDVSIPDYKSATLDRKRFRFGKRKSRCSKNSKYFRVGNSTFYNGNSLADVILDTPLPPKSPIYQVPSNLPLGPSLYQTLPSNIPRAALFSDKQYNLYKLISSNRKVDFSQSLETPRSTDIYDHLDTTQVSAAGSQGAAVCRLRANTWPDTQYAEPGPEDSYMKMGPTDSPVAASSPFSYLQGVSGKEELLRMTEQASPRVRDFLAGLQGNQLSESTDELYEVMSHPGSLADDTISLGSRDSKRSSLNSVQSQPVFNTPDYINQDFVIQANQAAAYLQSLSLKETESARKKKLNYVTLKHDGTPVQSNSSSGEAKTEYDLIDHKASKVMFDTVVHHRNNNNNKEVKKPQEAKK